MAFDTPSVVRHIDNNVCVKLILDSKDLHYQPIMEANMQ
jgi:hypothetical protein